MQISLPNAVLNIIKTLESAGFEAYIVGGCVRDILLGLTPDDYDITTSASPEEIKSLFKHTVDTGLKHGTVTVILENTPYEVTAFRTDGYYENHRKPQGVTFVKNINEDLARRDFTVNAIAYHPKKSFVDIFDGKNDINNKLLKAVGQPEKRFKEDALRILRLFRFACTLNFNIEDNTLHAALNAAHELEFISKERIAAELFKILLSNYPQNSQPLLSCKALNFIGISSANFAGFENLEKDRMIRFAAFCLNNNINSLTLCKQLKLDNNLYKYLQNLSNCLSCHPSSREEIKKSMRDFGTKATKDALKLYGGNFGEVDDILEKREPFLVSHLALNGNDLLQEGINGNCVGETLKLLTDKVISCPSLNTKKELLKICKQP